VNLVHKKKVNKYFFSDLIDEFNSFFEVNNISQINRDITIRYLKSLRRDRVTDRTIRNNANQFKFILTNIKTDLDKLTRDDVTNYCDILSDYLSKDNEPLALSTDKQYRIVLQRFLTRYTDGLSDEQIEHRAKIAKLLKTSNKVQTESRTYESILTKKEVDRIISSAKNDRDAAIVSVLYDSGCRIGELLNCNIKDIEWNNDGYRITLRGKTGTRKVQCVESTHELSSWLAHHPLKNDMHAPLFVTLMQLSETYEEVNSKGATADFPP